MTERDLRAGASASQAALLLSPPRPARVLSQRHGRLSLVDEGTRHIVALVAADGTCLPNSLVLDRQGDARRLGTVGPGDTVTIAHGTLVLGDVTVQVTSWADRRLHLTAVDPCELAARLEWAEWLLARQAHLPDPLRDRLDDVCSSALAADREAAFDAAMALLGLGPGLTPSGDDLLAGLVAAGRTVARALPGVGATDRLLEQLGGDLAEAAWERTTRLSATLLWHAARAELAAPARAVLLGLAGRTRLAPAVHRLLALGHTSGRDLAHGITAGLRLGLATRSEVVRT